jgi:hypothetical protein
MHRESVWDVEGIFWGPLSSQFIRWALVVTAAAKLHNFCIESKFSEIPERFQGDVQVGDVWETLDNNNNNENTNDNPLFNGVIQQAMGRREILTGIFRPTFAVPFAVPLLSQVVLNVSLIFSHSSLVSCANVCNPDIFDRSLATIISASSHSSSSSSSSSLLVDIWLFSTFRIFSTFLQNGYTFRTNNYLFNMIRGRSTEWISRTVPFGSLISKLESRRASASSDLLLRSFFNTYTSRAKIAYIIT